MHVEKKESTRMDRKRIVEQGCDQIAKRYAALAAQYPFAFTVPFKKRAQAKIWLTASTTLLAGDGKDEFANARMRTHNDYFPDLTGNILDFIAYEDLPATAGTDCGAEDVVHLRAAFHVIGVRRERRRKRDSTLDNIFMGYLSTKFDRLVPKEPPVLDSEKR
jgi:hypothetical protein